MSTPLDENEFSRWMRSSLHTLESAKRDLRFDDYAWACFKAHQAAEKTSKAFYGVLGSLGLGIP